MVLDSKGEAANAIKRVQVAVEAECGRKLRVLCTDNSCEFTTVEFASYCADEGVQRPYSVPYSPQQNSVVEWRNERVVGMARALLKQRGMSAVFWGEVMVTAVYILNLLPTKALNGMTPYEAWHGRKLVISHLRVRLPHVHQGAWPHRQARRQEHSRGVHWLRGGLEGLPHP
jgi:hypothetical protein